MLNIDDEAGLPSIKEINIDSKISRKNKNINSKTMIAEPKKEAEQKGECSPSEKKENKPAEVDMQKADKELNLSLSEKSSKFEKRELDKIQLQLFLQSLNYPKIDKPLVLVVNLNTMSSKRRKLYAELILKITSDSEVFSQFQIIEIFNLNNIQLCKPL